MLALFVQQADSRNRMRRYPVEAMVCGIPRPRLIAACEPIPSICVAEWSLPWAYWCQASPVGAAAGGDPLSAGQFESAVGLVPRAQYH
jgi:hypothetical protein